MRPHRLYGLKPLMTIIHNTGLLDDAERQQARLSSSNLGCFSIVRNHYVNTFDLVLATPAAAVCARSEYKAARSARQVQPRDC